MGGITVGQLFICSRWRLFIDHGGEGWGESDSTRSGRFSYWIGRDRGDEKRVGLHSCFNSACRPGLLRWYLGDNGKRCMGRFVGWGGKGGGNVGGCTIGQVDRLGDSGRCGDGDIDR